MGRAMAVTAALAFLAAGVGAVWGGEADSVSLPMVQSMAASCLRVPVAKLTIHEFSATERNLTIRCSAGDAADVLLDLDPATHAVRSVRWLAHAEPAADATAVSAAAALAVAQELFSRWHPETPARMVRSAVIRLHLPVYVVRWQGYVADDVLSGDMVTVHVSATTGGPVLYLQRIAPVRPDLGDVIVSKAEAVAIAAEALRETLREGFARRESRATLALSCPIVSGQGPAWMVGFTVVGQAHAEVICEETVIVDATTGQVVVALVR